MPGIFSPHFEPSRFNISGSQTLSGSQTINGNSTINGNFNVSGSTYLSGSTSIYNNFSVTGSTILSGSDTTIYGDFNVSGSIYLSGSTHIQVETPIHFISGSTVGDFYFVNIARNVTPTTTNFQTPPTSLGNMTDGNSQTSTGIGLTTGSTALGGGGCARLRFDLGTDGNVATYLGMLHFAGWTQNGTQVDGYTALGSAGFEEAYTRNAFVSFTNQTAEKIIAPLTFTGSGRYLTIIFVNQVAQEVNLRFYEMKVIRLS